MKRFKLANNKFTCCATLLLGSLSLQAEDFLLSGASARSAGAGGVYQSGWNSALDAMALNPAGLASLQRKTLDVSLAAAFARGRFQNAANTNGRLNSNGAIPYGAFGAPIGGTRFTLGFGAMPELLSIARWSYNDAPGGAGNIRYPISQHHSEITAVRFAGGVGFALNSKVHLGATLGAVYNQNTLQTAYVFQQHPVLAGLKTQLDLRTTGIGWNGSVGVLIRPSSHFEFGGTYKSKTVIQSTGSATGNIGVQLAAIGLGAARPDFQYDARVDNVLPQSLLFHETWNIRPTMRLTTQGEWVNWKRAFVRLPVILTNGNNSDINGVLGTNGIRDFIPLDWKNQWVERVGFEKDWKENTTFRTGYAHVNNPVPQSTLSPLTAAITQNSISAGFSYRRGTSRFDAAYVVDPSVRSSVGQSALRSGEYNNSSVSVRVQSLQLTWSIALP